MGADVYRDLLVEDGGPRPLTASVLEFAQVSSPVGRGDLVLFGHALRRASARPVEQNLVEVGVVLLAPLELLPLALLVHLVQNSARSAGLLGREHPRAHLMSTIGSPVPSSMHSSSCNGVRCFFTRDRKSTRLNSSQ